MPYQRTDFDLGPSLDDELRVDQRCRALLQAFHRYLLQQRQLAPLEAGSLAAGTDYLLRDFLIDHCRENILDLSPQRLRQFGGTWYILKNLEPNLKELRRSLQGCVYFASYCASLGLMAPEREQALAVVAADEMFFQQRIDAFHALKGDGYTTWEAACTLDDVGRVL